MTEYITFSVRIPTAIIAKLEEEAESQRRSRNGQLVRVLEERYRLTEQTEKSDSEAA